MVTRVGLPASAVLFAAACILGGCSDDAAEGSLQDASGGDPPMDAAQDRATDSTPATDLGPDVGADLGADLGSDTGADDLGPDMTPDDAGGDGACTPPADDPSGIGTNCEGPAGADPTLCPDGYECLPFFAFIFTYTCEIRCTRACECPPPSTCGERCDNQGCIDACVP